MAKKQKDIRNMFAKIGYSQIYKVSNNKVFLVREEELTDNTYVDEFKLQRNETVNIPFHRWVSLCA